VQVDTATMDPRLCIPRGRIGEASHPGPNGKRQRLAGGPGEGDNDATQYRISRDGDQGGHSDGEAATYSALIVLPGAVITPTDQEVEHIPCLLADKPQTNCSALPSGAHALPLVPASVLACR